RSSRPAIPPRWQRRSPACSTTPPATSSRSQKSTRCSASSARWTATNGCCAAPPSRPGGGAMADPAAVERMVRNEADMAYRRRVQTIFEWLDPQDGDRILDAGSGRGFYLKFLRAASGADLTGLEYEHEFASMARDALGDLPGITLVSGSVYDPPFPDEAFDKIILSEVLEHLPDDAGGLRSLARVLKPGGLIAITVPNANYPFWWDPINKTLETLFHTHVRRGAFAGIWANHVRLYTHDELFRAVWRSGLELVDARSFTHHSFPFIHNIVYGFG